MPARRPGAFSARRTAFLGMLFALALALSFFESLLGGMMALPPAVKPGFSNIVVLFAMLSLGKGEAFTLVLLKSFFALLTRGPVAALLSLGGGLCSLGVMLPLVKSKRLRVSVFLLSVLGAVTHNFGQLALASLLLYNRYILFYLPVLVLSGILAGLLTGAVYRAARPYFAKILKLQGETCL